MLALPLFTSSLFAETKPTPTTNTAIESSHLININSASISELNHAYKGIGARRSKAIVAYRSKHGPFQSVKSLAKVRQIGNAYITKNLSGLEQVFTVGE